MAKMKRRCDYCKKEYWTTIVKVYVFKERKCPKKKCGGMLFAHNNEQYFKCLKCGLEIKFDDNIQLGRTSVRLRGTSKDWRVREKMSVEGVEVDVRKVPEKRYCQRCRNLKTIMNNAIRSRMLKRGTRELPIEEAQQILRAQIQRKIQAQTREKADAEKSPVKVR